MLERLMGKKFWNLYFRVYDRNKSIPYNQLMKQNASLLVAGRPNGHFLDLGCGTGNSTGAVLEQLAVGGRVLGLDNSVAAVEIADKKFPDERISFLHADMARHLPFADRTFDGVLANNSLYLVKDPAPVISEILRVLRPGGNFPLNNPSETATSSPILKAHLAAKLVEYEQLYGKVLGTTALAWHSLTAVGNYLLLLPFQLALISSFKMVSNFWPQEKWQEVFAAVRQTSPIPFALQAPFQSYAGQTITFIGHRLDN